MLLDRIVPLLFKDSVRFFHVCRSCGVQVVPVGVKTIHNVTRCHSWVYSLKPKIFIYIIMYLLSLKTLSSSTFFYLQVNHHNIIMSICLVSHHYCFNGKTRHVYVIYNMGYIHILAEQANGVLLQINLERSTLIT